jgi:fatty acid desaturase
MWDRKMKKSSWVQEAVGAGQRFHFSRQNPLKHNFYNLFWLGLILISIGFTVWMKRSLPLISFNLLAVPVLGYLFFLLLVLVVHEASHNYFILSSDQNRKIFWNRFFGRLVCIPFGMDYLRVWEEGHRLHHQHTSRAEDGELCSPQTGQILLKRAAKVLLIPGYIQLLGVLSGKGVYYGCPIGQKKEISWRSFIFFGIFCILGFPLFAFLGGVNTLVIFITLNLAAQVMSFLVIMRQPLEHGGDIVLENKLYLRSRSTLSRVRFLLQPFNLNYHFEHHLYQSIPWYHLKKFHQELQQIVPKPLQPYLYTIGLKDVCRQILGKKSSIPEELRSLIT